MIARYSSEILDHSVCMLINKREHDFQGMIYISERLALHKN